MMRGSAILKKCKPLQKPLETFVFPVLLLIWPLVNANQGISVMDTTYSLTNYVYPESVGSTWKFATLLANAMGTFLARTPLGGSMLAMNLVCSLLIGVTALVSYEVLRRMIAGWMVFIGEFLAISLCWCPAVILYNYLTYFLLTLGCLFLFRGISGVPEKQSWYVLAGVCLGASVTVRFANLAEAALILPLWFWCAITGRKAIGALKRTLWCLLGYVIGFAVPVGISMAVYGPTAYFAMIPQILGVGSANGDYTAGGMISAILSAYGEALHWFLILIPCIIMGIILFHLPLWEKHRGIKKLIYTVGILILVRFFYGRGMFTTVYTDYWCMFAWGMLFLLMAILLCLIFLFGGFAANPDERFLAAMTLCLVLILPLGSNNYTFPVLNCLFVIAPAVLWFLRRIWQETRDIGGHFAWHSMAMMILVMVLVQGALFHIFFAFRDGTDGTRRTAQVAGNAITAGMYTTPENAKELSSLTALVKDQNLAGRKTIVLGSAPGLHYLLQLPPALSSAWPDLDSNPTQTFAQDLAACEEEPLVILHYGGEPSASAAEKTELLEEYLSDRSYETLFEDGVYTVLCPAGEEP
ncbi:MAG: hypothetical protein LKH04_01075 [Lachnospiraceae bacterium]|jgi:hypothetical protein|nr:hypothetical protein [Lachnospiraceae bacterium]MCH4109095.1 hypothetical protein [Lachnospiraceae bacterium]MCI1398382.1 hypothetical protein [Lachnospiraceae bacterium]MCI1422886.1 hypothetical protein [Lachnospiraceae bacterium]MCI1451615.1 hypothetical protein [Lachnospiraceae bacterium]